MVLGVAMIGGVVFPSGAVWSQENRGTVEQQMACTPDVWRLCSDRIPDVDRIVACLQRNRLQLSDACRAVFEPANGGQQAQVPRGRSPQPRPDYDDDE
jgi:hypothetical protein